MPENSLQPEKRSLGLLNYASLFAVLWFCLATMAKYSRCYYPEKAIGMAVTCPTTLFGRKWGKDTYGKELRAFVCYFWKAIYFLWINWISELPRSILIYNKSKNPKTVPRKFVKLKHVRFYIFELSCTWNGKYKPSFCPWKQRLAPIFVQFSIINSFYPRN